MSHNSLEKILEGVVFFWSETGTEGGHWAFQDSRYIKKSRPRYGIFGNTKVWDAQNPDREGKSLDDIEVYDGNSWIPFPDPITKDPDYQASSLFRGEERGDRNADERLMQKYGFRMIYVEERADKKFGKGNWEFDEDRAVIAPDGTSYFFGSTPATKPKRPYGVGKDDKTRSTIRWNDGEEEQRLSNTLLVHSWDYKGLNVLVDGQHLSIYRPETNEEVWSGVIDLEHHDLFSEDVRGLWVHADQRGVDRDVWGQYFFNEYPAKLVLK